MAFRLKLLRKDGAILGEKIIRAASNYDAMQIAGGLAEGVVGCDSYTLWRGERKIVRYRHNGWALIVLPAQDRRRRV